nr:HipA domain-containing protein [uncultured Massilia sp.]
MSFTLDVFAGERPIARIGHDPMADRWSLVYSDDWLADRQAFPLSPPLPLLPSERGHDSRSIKRFIEHLLPEGHALDVAIAANGLARSNVFGLIRALGNETAGVLRFQDAETAPGGAMSMPAMREITVAELDARIADRAIPFSVWDGKVRMSVAGVQDKLLVYAEAPPQQGGRMFLVDGPRLASTYLLKPSPAQGGSPHLAINEYFCMTLARRIGLPAAEVGLLRTPHPVLVVRRFDRIVHGQGDGARVARIHMVDACQACDLPVSFKYERNLGSGADVRAIRDGMNFERLFGLSDLAANKASAKLAMLRWALLQYLIGNTDAHGKNFSFFVHAGGYLDPTPWYDLVSVIQYEGNFDTELAMAYGDAFTFDDVTPYALADFASRCGVDRKLLRREAQRLSRLAADAAGELARSPDYQDDERDFIAQLAAFVKRQAQRLPELAREAATIPSEHL